MFSSKGHTCNTKYTLKNTLNYCEPKPTVSKFCYSFQESHISALLGNYIWFDTYTEIKLKISRMRDDYNTFTLDNHFKYLSMSILSDFLWIEFLKRASESKSKQSLPQMTDRTLRIEWSLMLYLSSTVCDLYILQCSLWSELQ